MSFATPGTPPRFNPPPNWPAPPPGWSPPPGWVPDPSWPPLPEGWQLWIEDPGTARLVPGAAIGTGVHKSGRPPRWVIIAGAVLIGLIIANVMHGITGRLIALVVWVIAAWSCVRPAKAQAASAARAWARIGVAACTCLAVYAASLAIAAELDGTPNWYSQGEKIATTGYQDGLPSSNPVGDDNGYGAADTPAEAWCADILFATPSELPSNLQFTKSFPFDSANGGLSSSQQTAFKQVASGCEAGYNQAYGQ